MSFKRYLSDQNAYETPIKRARSASATPGICKPLFPLTPKTPGSVSAFDSFSANEFTSWIDNIRVKASAALLENKAADDRLRRRKQEDEEQERRRKEECEELIAVIEEEKRREEIALLAAVEKARLRADEAERVAAASSDEEESELFSDEDHDEEVDVESSESRNGDILDAESYVELAMGSQSKINCTYYQQGSDEKSPDSTENTGEYDEHYLTDASSDKIEQEEELSENREDESEEDYDDDNDEDQVDDDDDDDDAPDFATDDNQVTPEIHVPDAEIEILSSDEDDNDLADELEAELGGSDSVSGREPQSAGVDLGRDHYFFGGGASKEEGNESSIRESQFLEASASESCSVLYPVVNGHDHDTHQDDIVSSQQDNEENQVVSGRHFENTEEDEMYRFWKEDIEASNTGPASATGHTQDLPLMPQAIETLPYAHLETKLKHSHHGHAMEESTEEVHDEVAGEKTAREILDETERNFEVTNDPEGLIAAVQEKQVIDAPMTEAENHTIDAEQRFLRAFDDLECPKRDDEPDEMSELPETIELEEGSEDEDEEPIEDEGMAGNLEDFLEIEDDDESADSLVSVSKEASVEETECRPQIDNKDVEFPSTGVHGADGEEEVNLVEPTEGEDLGGNLEEFLEPEDATEEGSAKLPVSVSKDAPVEETRSCPQVDIERTESPGAKDEDQVILDAAVPEDDSSALVHVLRDGLEYVDAPATALTTSNIKSVRVTRSQSRSKTPQSHQS